MLLCRHTHYKKEGCASSWCVDYRSEDIMQDRGAAFKAFHLSKDRKATETGKG